MPWVYQSATGLITAKPGRLRRSAFRDDFARHSGMMSLG